MCAAAIGLLYVKSLWRANQTAFQLSVALRHIYCHDALDFPLTKLATVPSTWHTIYLIYRKNKIILIPIKYTSICSARTKFKFIPFLECLVVHDMRNVVSNFSFLFFHHKVTNSLQIIILTRKLLTSHRPSPPFISFLTFFIPWHGEKAERICRTVSWWHQRWRFARTWC